jgi:formamidopyrimidine-DNA glycosylase
MPELPEVEVGRRQLERWATGRSLESVHIVDRAVVRRSMSTKPSDALPDGPEQVQSLVGQTAGRPVRHGKRLGWSFGRRGLLCHFGMTGHWIRRPTGETPPQNSRIGLGIGGATLWYVDSRRWGCVVVVESSEIEDALRSGVGPDALDEALGASELRKRVQSRKPIKVALMEQERLAGLGNIHAAEACFRAKVLPGKQANTLADPEWEALAPSIVDQLRFAIDAEGGGARDDFQYVNLGGPNPFSVYARTGEPCPVCATKITSEDMSGRTTYWCPNCQK